MNKYCATFYTHYGAMKFHKICNKSSLESKIAPVPRKVSASCTTCVFFHADDTDILADQTNIEDLEACYIVEGDSYKKLS